MVGGPIFIAQVAGQTARQGLPTLLSFMALLSVNLALLNILPIPLLDGGQLLIMAIESIKGQPLSQRQRMVIQQLGLVLIIMLIAVVFFNDVTR
jgi:regulator of sigma E protease